MIKFIIPIALIILFGLWLRYYKRKQAIASFFEMHKKIHNDLMNADRYKEYEADRISKVLEDLQELSCNKKTDKAVQEHLQLWRAKFAHLYK